MEKMNFDIWDKVYIKEGIIFYGILVICAITDALIPAVFS